jgi:MraZ protein
MLIGEYNHTLDAKRRVALPAKLRKELGKKIVITNGFDKCLFIYPVKEWQKFSDKLSGLPVGQADIRGVNRFMFGGAMEQDVDSLGRILVPEFLSRFAELATKIVLVGVQNRVEVWEEGNWKAYKERIAGQADVLAEKLGEIGAL